MDADWRQAQVFFVFGLFVIAAMALALHQWIVRPLGTVIDSLASGDPAGVTALAKQRSELGRVAGLVVEAFGQRQALQREVEQRTRAQRN